ncbi:cornifin alpha-like [Molothrus ater]|uniref:cornifin alpha-like n=1 Tax=Molothrus ater TaxID=84834 RepID=UPI0017485229|nr:cornifin alpha-like [Molothrus ater]
MEDATWHHPKPGHLLQQDPLKHPKIPSSSLSPPVPRHTFRPPPFPAVPSAPPLYSSQGASANVRSPGVPAPCSHGIPAPCSHGIPAPCQPPVPAPCSPCVPAPSPGSHGGGTPTALPHSCIRDPIASNSKDTGQEAADPVQGPTLSFAPVSYQPAAQGGVAPTANWSSFG